MNDAFKLLICGFMGAGKTTLMNRFKLEKSLFEFVDLDDELKKKFAQGYDNLGYWIRSIGWEKFRQKEEECLREVEERHSKIVIALGGGTVTEEFLKNLRSKPSTKLVFLDIPFDICWDRIKKDSIGRPLAVSYTHLTLPTICSV